MSSSLGLPSSPCYQIVSLFANATAAAAGGETEVALGPEWYGTAALFSQQATSQQSQEAKGQKQKQVSRVRETWRLYCPG